MTIPTPENLLAIIDDVTKKFARYGNNSIDIMLRRAEDPLVRPSGEEITRECLMAFAAYYLIRKHHQAGYFHYEVANNLPRAVPNDINGWGLTEHPANMKERFLDQLMPYINKITENN